MSNAVLVIQWEEVMVNVDSFYKLRNEQEIDIYSNANYQLIEPNRPLFKFVKNISRDIPVMIPFLPYSLIMVGIKTRSKV